MARSLSLHDFRPLSPKESSTSGQPPLLQQALSPCGLVFILQHGTTPPAQIFPYPSYARALLHKVAFPPQVAQEVRPSRAATIGLPPKHSGPSPPLSKRSPPCSYVLPLYSFPFFYEFGREPRRRGSHGVLGVARVLLLGGFILTCGPFAPTGFSF